MRLPDSLQGVFFDGLWDKRKIWSLDTPATTVPLEDLTWQLDLTVWTTVPGEPRFDLSPLSVLRDLPTHPVHAEKIESADLELPLELFRNGERWVIVDGYHRLCAHTLARSKHVPVRLHPKARWADVGRDEGTGADSTT